MKHAPHQLPYVGALDGIRALAIAGVLLYHGDVSWAPGGFLGVDVFFVLSGFLITSLLLHELGSSGRLDLRRFWLRRARRLLPAAFLVIAVCALVATFFYVGDLGRVRGDALASFLYVNNWHQIVADRSYFAGFARPSTLQHLWSLAVEEQFYLLWPLALGGGLALMGRRATAIVTLVAAVGSALAMGLVFDPGRDPTRVYFGTDTHASGLLIGALLAFVWPLGRMRADIKKGAVVVLDVAALGLAAILAAMATWQDYDTFVYRGGLPLVAVATAVLIAAVVHPASRAGRLFALTPLRWIGERSYGIYLWHWPVMVLTRPGIDLDWSRWLLVPAQIAVTIAIAAASYRWVEMPFRTGAAPRAIKGWLDRRRPRLRLGITTSVALAIVAVGVAVAARNVPAPRVVETRSAAAATTPSRDRGEVVPNRRPLAVGASVMLSARKELERHATVDAAVGRQPSDIIGRLATYRDAGKLPTEVIVQIGENGPLDSYDERVLQYTLRDVRRVVVVNVRSPRSWTPEVNGDLKKIVKKWPEARLVDWYKASGKGDYLGDDLTHPNLAGQRLYARLIKRALRQR